jgi:hypothetical protein
LLTYSAVGSKVVLKLKRNITSIGFDTFHVLIERRPTTAPNSPQNSAPRGNYSPGISPSPTVGRIIQDNTIGLDVQKSTSRNSASAFTTFVSKSASCSPPTQVVHAKSTELPAIATISLSEPSSASGSAAGVFQPLSACLEFQESPGSSNATIRPGLNTEEQGFVQQYADADSRANFCISQSSASRDIVGSTHEDRGEEKKLQASCHRKLQLDVDSQEFSLPKLILQTCVDDPMAKDSFSLQSKQQHGFPSEIVTEKEVDSIAIVAQEQPAITAWAASQAQVISATDSPPSAQQHEALQQRLEEQRMWGMINSTILSDLIKSLGSKSIFHH